MSKTVSARIDDNLHTLITDEANQDTPISPNFPWGFL